MYEKEFPDEKISDYEKGNTLKDMVPEEIRVDLVRMEKRGYENIHEYVTTQIPLRREEAMRKKGQKYMLNAVREEEPPAPPPHAGEMDSLLRNGGRGQRPARADG